jgi:hypothetical protein
MCRKRLVLRHRNFGKSGRLVELCSCSEYLTTSIAVGASSMTTRSQGTGITPSRCRWSCPTCRTARSRAKRSELSTRIVRTPPPATAAKSLRFHCVMAASCGNASQNGSTQFLCHRSRHALPASRPQMPKINAEGLSGWFAARLRMHGRRLTSRDRAGSCGLFGPAAHANRHRGR